MPTWNPSLAIGHAEIDGQHQELFARTDRLLAAMKEGQSAAEVKKLLDFLAQYCDEHFGAEETLMRLHRYPDLKAHLEQHAIFIEKLRAILDQFQAKGPSVTVSLAVQQLVCGWLVQHIGTVDKKLAAALNAVARPRV